MSQNYDIGIIGAGVAGAFASLRIAEHHKNKKAILFDLGRPPGKRRRQLEGWFGCFPTGDGKVYTNDTEKVLDIADGRRVKSINKWFKSKLDEVHPGKLIKSKMPNSSVLKKIKNANFELEVKNYIQWHPDNIHQLSRLIAERVEDAGNIEFSFDNEVHEFRKKRGGFIVSTDNGDYNCKKLILCAGRTGWRWVNQCYKELGILIHDNVAKYGIHVEIPAQYMKEFNKSHCLLTKDDLRVGPISWNGSIIQEDHADLTVAAFRSNEDRWKTDKVFFSITGIRHFDNDGIKQTDRLAKLAFLLFGDRVGREKIKTLIKKSSQLNLIPEYNWVINAIEEINDIIPALISRGYYHCPDIYPLMSEIRLGSNLETEVNGLFVAGESAGIYGIGSAGITGAVAVESALK